MSDGSEAKVIRFCRPFSIGETRKRQLKIHGAVTSSAPRTPSEKPPRPLIALSEENPVRESLLRRLRRLDAEQQQVVEIIADAIARGAL